MTTVVAACRAGIRVARQYVLWLDRNAKWGVHRKGKQRCLGVKKYDCVSGLASQGRYNPPWLRIRKATTEGNAGIWKVWSKQRKRGQDIPSFKGRRTKSKAASHPQ